MIAPSTRKVYQGKHLYASIGIVARLPAMNEFTAHESHAAAQLQAKAATLVCTYAHPQDAAAARLAVLMIACQHEAREQGITAPLVFAHIPEYAALPVIDMAAPGAAAALVAISGAKHDQGKDGV